MFWFLSVLSEFNIPFHRNEFFSEICPELFPANIWYLKLIYLCFLNSLLFNSTLIQFFFNIILFYDLIMKFALKKIAISTFYKTIWIIEWLIKTNNNYLSFLRNFYQFIKKKKKKKKKTKNNATCYFKSDFFLFFFLNKLMILRFNDIFIP